MKVIIYALAAVLAVPSTLGQHHTHTRRLGVANEQAAMSIDMITDAMSMQSTAAVEPNDGPVYPVFGKGGKSGGHGGPTPATSGKSGKSGSGPTAPSAPGSGKGGKSGPTAPSDGGSSKSGKSATTTQATSPGTTGGTTSGTDATTPGTGSTVMTTGGTTSGTDPTTPDTTVMTTDATTPVTSTPPDTTVMTTSPPPAGECTIDNSDDMPPFSTGCSGRFCCTPTNTNNSETTCETPPNGQPCGKGPAQLDLCTEPPDETNVPGTTDCDPGTQECCKDANNSGDICCIPNDLDSVGLSCRIIPDGYCDLPQVFRDNGLAVFLLGLILQALGLFDGNRRNLRSVVDEQGIQDIVAKFASLIDEEEGGMEGVMAKVADLGVDADMMNQLANVIGN